MSATADSAHLSLIVQVLRALTYELPKVQAHEARIRLKLSVISCEIPFIATAIKILIV